MADVINVILHLSAPPSESYRREKIIRKRADFYKILLLLRKVDHSNHVEFMIGARGCPESVRGFVRAICGIDIAEEGGQ